MFIRPKDQSESNQSIWLDVLRGLAIFGVVMVHTTEFLFQKLGYNVTWITSKFLLGKYGVELFFFLSGWLLCSIYGISGNKLTRKYWLRRFARIYPLWVLFMVYQLVKWQFFSTSSGNLIKSSAAPNETFFTFDTFSLIFLTLTFTLFFSDVLWNSVIPGGWSIQAEVAHYILFSVLRNKNMNRIFLITSFVNIFTFCLVKFSPLYFDQGNFFYKLIHAYLRLGVYSTFGFFLLGIVAFLFINSSSASSSLIKITGRFGLFNSSFLCFFMTFFLIPCPFGSQIEAVVIVTLILVISLPILQNDFLTRIFKLFGKYSYFIYFMHYLVISWLDRVVLFYKLTPGDRIPFAVTFFVVYFTVMLLSLAGAMVSFRYIERPAIEWARKFS